jgi:hypothetical protein
MLMNDKTCQYYQTRGCFASDLKAFHCCVAMMDTLNAFFLDQQSLSKQTAWHIDQAIHSVSEKLNTPSILDESSFLVVNFLIVQALVQENDRSVSAHRKGLKLMIQLAGGLDNMDLEYTLALKIYRYDFQHRTLLRVAQLIIP